MTKYFKVEGSDMLNSRAVAKFLKYAHFNFNVQFNNIENNFRNKQK